MCKLCPADLITWSHTQAAEVTQLDYALDVTLVCKRKCPRRLIPMWWPLQDLLPQQHRLEWRAQGSAKPLVSEFVQSSTSERELTWASKRVRTSGEVLFKTNTMAKHQLKCSPSLHSAVKWLTLLAAAEHSSWLWFAGSDRTYRWPTPSQSLELWIPFRMASRGEEQGNRNTKPSVRHTLVSFVVYLQIIDSTSALPCHFFHHPSSRDREEDEWFSAQIQEQEGCRLSQVVNPR